MSEALWTPSPERVIKANMTEFLRYVEERGGPPVPDYSADWYWQLHKWSVDNPERFWSLTWRFCGIIGHRGTRRFVVDIVAAACFTPADQQVFMIFEGKFSLGDEFELLRDSLGAETGPILDGADANGSIGRSRIEEAPARDRQPCGDLFYEFRRKPRPLPKAFQHRHCELGSRHGLVARLVPQLDVPEDQDGGFPSVG